MLCFRYSKHVLRIVSFLLKSCIFLFRLIYRKLAQNSLSQIRFVGINLSCSLWEVKRCKMFPFSFVLLHHDLIIVLILIELLAHPLSFGEAGTTKDTLIESRRHLSNDIYRNRLLTLGRDLVMLVYLPMSRSKSSIGVAIVKFAFPDEFVVEESSIMSTSYSNF